MLGERLDWASVGVRGLRGDRRYAVQDADGKFGSGKTTRRFRLLEGLFAYSARTVGNGVVVGLPDGREFGAGSGELDALLSARYGEGLRVTPEGEMSHLDAGPVHILTTASLRWLGGRLGDGEVAAARFRPNLLVAAAGAGRPEEGWVGAELCIGSCVLRVTTTAERCVMVNNAQRGIRHDPVILRALARSNDGRLGVYAEVLAPGILREGAKIEVVPSPHKRSKKRV